MDERRDVAIIALAIMAATCLAVFLLDVSQPTGELLSMLLS